MSKRKSPSTGPALQKRFKANHPPSQVGVQPCHAPQQQVVPMVVQQQPQLQPPTLEFLLLPNGNASPFVRIGLWDDAWRDAAQQNPGTLYNDAQENQSFIGRDSRRFYLRVIDDEAAQRNAATVTVDWWTRRIDHQNNDVEEDDDLPAQAGVTLTRVPNTSTYLSNALMLVTDDDDAGQATHSGLQGGGLQPRGAADHRLRKVTVNGQYRLDGIVRASYAHQNPQAASPVVQNADVFNRNPDERRRVRVHLLNVRDAVNGQCATTQQELARYQEVIETIYGRCGIFAEVDAAELDPPQSCTGWDGRYAAGEDPGVFIAAQDRSQNPPKIVPHPSQTDLIQAIPNRQMDEVYLFFLANVYDLVAEAHAGGEAFYAAQTVHPPNLGHAAPALNEQLQAQALAAELYQAQAQQQQQNRAQRVENLLAAARQVAAQAAVDDYHAQAQAFWNHVEGVRVAGNTPQWLSQLIGTAQGQAGNTAYVQNQITNAMDGARGCAFLVRQNLLNNDFAPAHELTHITTDIDNAADGHFDLEAANSQAPGPIDGKNLMHRYELDAGNPQGVDQPKRLWDHPAVNANRQNMALDRQIQSILNGGFVHNY